MNEQKNLYLAIAISIAIIVFFQLLFPTTITEPIKETEDEIIAPAASIDDQKNNILEIVKPKEDVLISSKRVNIETPSVKGSINLTGAILDDLTLSNYKESLDENSNKKETKDGLAALVMKCFREKHYLFARLIIFSIT